MKKYLIAAVCFCLSAFLIEPTVAQTTIQTTNVVVVYNNAQSNSLFEDVSRFYFDNGNLVLDQHGVTTQVPLSTIQRLELDAISTPVLGVGEWDDNSVLVYPNPISDKLFFSSNQEQLVEVRVFAMNGQLLFTQQLSTTESMDVSTLSKGMYILKINSQTYKFTKL